MSDMLDQILSLQYEAQHFGFHPRNCLDLVYNVFFENMTANLAGMKEHMMQEFKDIVPPFIIATQTDRMLEQLVKILDKCIDKLEIYLNTNVFVIQPHIILPEDEVHVKNPCTKEEEERLDAEIEELKQKIFVEKAKRFCLKKKIIEQKEIKKYLLSLQSELRCLLTIANQEGVTQENIQSLFSDLMKLVNTHPSNEDNKDTHDAVL